jgi:hypothetical protein
VVRDKRLPALTKTSGLTGIFFRMLTLFTKEGCAARTIPLKSSQLIRPEKRKGIIGIPSGLPKPKSRRKKINTVINAVG